MGGEGLDGVRRQVENSTYFFLSPSCQNFKDTPCTPAKISRDPAKLVLRGVASGANRGYVLAHCGLGPS